MTKNSVQFVKGQYETWPYPQVPLLAQVDRESLWQINYDWIAKRLGKEISPKPKIWIAGCGTFQPYVFSLANPKAEILATDLSETSLKRAKKRCAWHGLRNVQFEQLDLSQASVYPNQSFDFIECYGVLMSVPNPKEVLREFAKRLNPQGILRLMVYPHYGRQRVFHIQRLAKLLGLGPRDKAHPEILRKLMGTLTEKNPLKSTFFDYPDTQNLPGIVDGFLHASDRSFSGEEISQMLDEAGFELGFCYHRPWGQPEEMAKKLNLHGQDAAFWLHYLDLWQSLKSNFILTLVKKGSGPSKTPQSFLKHPLFDLRQKGGIKHRLRLVTHSLLGAKLQSRTHEGAFLKLNSEEYRSVLRGRKTTPNTEEVLGENKAIPVPFWGINRTFPKPSNPWRVALGVSPNPIYRHLFDAYTFSDQLRESEQGFPALEEEIKQWESCSRPLETEEKPWGLTPFSTYQEYQKPIQVWLKHRKNQKEFNLSEVRLKDESQKIEELIHFLRPQKRVHLPGNPEDLRALWILLMSEDYLFLEFEQ